MLHDSSFKYIYASHLILFTFWLEFFKFMYNIVTNIIMVLIIIWYSLCQYSNKVKQSVYLPSKHYYYYYCHYISLNLYINNKSIKKSRGRAIERNQFIIAIITLYMLYTKKMSFALLSITK